MSENRVQVFVRCRPRIMTSVNALHAAERFAADAITKSGDTNVIVADNKSNASGATEIKSQEFPFDGMFDPDSTQEELYEFTTLDAVDAVLQGTHATIFCYGMTGSGKTFTALGYVPQNAMLASPTSVLSPTTFTNNATSLIHPNTGLFLRVVHDLLHFAKNQKQFHVVISINVLEVYLDSVRDLLAKDATAELKVMITEEYVAIPQLVHKEVTSLTDAIKVYDSASKRRIARSTDSNDSSSRSHALFNIDVYRQPIHDSNRDRPLTLDDVLEVLQTAIKKPPLPKPETQAKYADACKNGYMFMLRGNAGGAPVLASRITLTDLAGSEKMKQANSKGQAFDEMVKINGSLTALGNVIHALYEGSKHIPYRDTRLTVLLRDAFSSPGSKIVLIANIAPTVITYDETYSTLLFANKVKAMKAGAGKASAGAEFAMQQALTGLLRKFDEFACDLRVFSAQQSPEDERTKAIVAMLETKRKRQNECKGGENDPRVAAVKEVSEKAKQDRANALESISTDLPKQILEEYRTNRAAVQKDLDEKLNLQKNSVSMIQTLDTEIAKCQKELETRKEDLPSLETKKKTLDQRKSGLDAELDSSQKQLSQLTTITDPEEIALRAEQEALRKEIEQIDRVFETSFTPMTTKIKEQLQFIQTKIDAISKEILTKEAFAASKTEFDEESALYDPVKIQERVEKLDPEFQDELTNPERNPFIILQKEGTNDEQQQQGGVTTPPNNSDFENNMRIFSPGSPNSAGATSNVVAADGTKRPMFIPPPPISRSGSVVFPQQQFASPQQQQQQQFLKLSERSASCYVGPMKKAPPPPPPPPSVFDSNKVLVKKPVPGKKVQMPPPPPGRSPSTVTSSAGYGGATFVDPTSTMGASNSDETAKRTMPPPPATGPNGLARSQSVSYKTAPPPPPEGTFTPLFNRPLPRPGDASYPNNNDNDLGGDNNNNTSASSSPLGRSASVQVYMGGKNPPPVIPPRKMPPPLLDGTTTRSLSVSQSGSPQSPPVFLGGPSASGGVGSKGSPASYFQKKAMVNTPVFIDANGRSVSMFVGERPPHVPPPPPPRKNAISFVGGDDGEQQPSASPEKETNDQQQLDSSTTGVTDGSSSPSRRMPPPPITRPPSSSSELGRSASAFVLPTKSSPTFGPKTIAGQAPPPPPPVTRPVSSSSFNNNNTQQQQTGSPSSSSSTQQQQQQQPLPPQTDWNIQEYDSGSETGEEDEPES